MSIELIRGELERLYSLEEMMDLSSRLLGFEPREVGGTASSASFARALTDHCQQRDAVAALIEAVHGTKPGASPQLPRLVQDVLRAPVELKAGDAFGPYTIGRKIGAGPNGTVYAARGADGDVVLKVLHASATHDRSSVHRFLTRNRLASGSASVPAAVVAGFVEDKPFVAYPTIDGTPLSQKLSSAGPMHLDEVRPVLRALVEALRSLHARNLTHGAVKPENVLVGSKADGSTHVTLVDAGGDLLWSAWIHSDTTAGNASRANTLAPELFKGAVTTPRSDLYALGALAFELLTGKPPLDESSAADLAFASVSRTPARAIDVAPRGWITEQVSDLIGRLLDKNPAARPDLDAIVAALGSAPAPAATIDPTEFQSAVDALLASPNQPEVALALEGTLDRGADARKVADAFTAAADRIDVEDAARQAGEAEENATIREMQMDAGRERARDAKKGLLFRAARILDSRLKDATASEGAYRAILALDPENGVALNGFENALKAQDKLDELVERLLEVSQTHSSHTERARAFHKIGQLYAGALDDRGQAVFAFAQALGQDAQNDGYADDLERSAGNDMGLWAEAMRELHEASGHPRMPHETRATLFLRLGRWYVEKIGRPDLGLPCFETVLSVDPASEPALEGIANVYRKAQQWHELVGVLVTRAERALTPSHSRDLRAEAAEILETRINDLGKARELYESVLGEDPGHRKTVDGLARVYQRTGDFAGYAKVLERQADALTGSARAETIARVGEIHEDNLNDLAEALRRFEAALEVDPGCLAAIRGLDRVYARSGRYHDLLANLERQVTISTTPRQKIALLERIAGIHDEEFLDHAKAADTLEKILAIDSGHEGSMVALMRHYRALSRWDDVNGLYERAVKASTDAARKAQLLLAQGSLLLEQIGSPERARQAYETVLQLEPQNPAALDALANLRAATGDAMAALAAVESLAEKAETPDARAEQWIRAGRILEQHGDRDGAIQRFKLALDAQPGNAAASDALRKAYLARGDAAGAALLLASEVDRTEGKLARAELLLELAQLRRERLNDLEGARDAALKAVAADPGNAAATLLLGDVAFDRGQFTEAASQYEGLVARIEVLGAADARRMLVRLIDALARSGSGDRAKNVIQTLLQVAPDDHEAIARAAKVQLDSGDSAGALATYDRLFESFGSVLAGDARGHALLHRGQALQATGRTADALAALNEAAPLLANAHLALDDLSRTYALCGAWEEVVRTKERQLTKATGEERTNLLVDMGEVLATELKDSARAAKNLLAALAERPDDRRVLTRLMRLYSEDKNWSGLLDVLLKLADSTEDSKQKSKFLHTAAGIAVRNMNDVDRGLALLARVVELDPDNDKAVSDAAVAQGARGNWQAVASLLGNQVERAQRTGDKAREAELHDKLGAVYKDQLGNIQSAVVAFERAQALAPDNAARGQTLVDLYSSDLDSYVDKALVAQHQQVRREPFNPAGYRNLRKLYTHKKDADAAWLTCQALHVMASAEPDEEKFFERMRSETLAAARDRVSPEEWASALTHELVDPLLTQIFQMIEPAIFARNAKPIDQLGLHPSYAVDLATYPAPLPQTLYYSAGVLGMAPPPAFQNPQDSTIVNFLHAIPPSIVLGAPGLAADFHARAAGFIAARHLAYYAPGRYVRHLVPTGTGLRAWLFGAIKLIHEGFPVAAELESTVRENSQAIRPTVEGPAREQLASLVTKLLHGGSIDLKRWVAGIDLSADRAGLLVCHDLELASELIKATDEATVSVPNADRVKELTLFSVDPAYLALRQRLGIRIDS